MFAPRSAATRACGLSYLKWFPLGDPNMKKSTRNHVPPCAIVKVVPFALVAAFFSLSLLGAKTVEIDNTGYRITVPDSFIVSKPPGAPDILLNGSRPDDKGTIQVVRDNPHGIAAQMAAVYEGKMQGALGNFSLQKKDLRTVNGRTCEFRQYQSFSSGMQIRVLALFYADGQQGFVIHSIDTTDSPVEFERALLSLQGPAPANPGLGAMPKLPSFSSGQPSGVVPIGDSGFTFTPPPDWQQFPSDQPTGLQYGLPDKTAVMEVLAVDIEEPIPDRAAFLDASLTQIESSFGPGWTKREQTPHATGGVNVLFKRFAGQLSGRDAQLLTIALTDGTQLVLAYGYYAAELVSTSGNAMRDSILSIKTGHPSTASAPSSPAPKPPTVFGVPPPHNPPPAITRSTPPAPPAPLPAVAAGWKSYNETHAGIHVPFPEAWEVDRQSSVITIGGPTGTAMEDMTINLQALKRNTPGNADVSAAVAKMVKDYKAMGARIENLEAFSLSNVPACRFHATINARSPGSPGFTHVFYYLLFERADIISVLSYVAPIDVWNEYLPIIQQSESGVRLDHTTAVSAPTVARAEPNTSREAYFALADAVAAQQWDWIVAHLTEKAMLNFCQLWREALPDADMTEAHAKANPVKTTREYLMYRKPKEDLAGYFERDRIIDGIREENPDWHLVMTTKATGGQHYLWFKRINGLWQFDY